LAAGGKTGEIVAKELIDRFPEYVKITKVTHNRVFAMVDKVGLLKVAKFMKDALDFDHITAVSGVDWLEEKKMWAVYHITSYSNRVTAEMIVELPRDKPEVDSVTPLWGGANWHERETYDMFGIIFIGHPRLERILTPEGTDYFPYRKDFVGGRRV
jgi:NADH-quinone oxidoreductase subunit C